MTTMVNTPTSVHLPVGIGKKELKRWRDSLSYVVTGDNFVKALIFLLISIFVRKTKPWKIK